jgi:hypothetical protein
MRAKIGDRCWLTGPVYPENVGRIVRVVGVTDHRLAQVWLVESEGSALRTQRGRTLRGTAYDEWLIPIRPGREAQPVPPREVTA